jgi:ribosomal protein S18 acetylase RimI-like enzyme
MRVGHSCPVTPPIQIRPAEASELDTVGELCVASYSAGGHLDPADDYAVTLRDAASRARSADVLVALRDGVIVGTVTICPPGSEFSEIGRGQESEFRFLAVAPSAWRTGVGEALVDECERRAVANGAPAHAICVIDRNHAAHRFYERLGFTRLPERDWEPRDGVHLQAYGRAVPYG